jgi:hypothetical protein
LWQGGGPFNDISDGLPKVETLPLLPSARKILESRLSTDDPQANCLPSGVPRNDRFWFDFKGHLHTERLHIVERYTRTNFNTLVNQITIEDLCAYSRPFTVTFTAELAPPDYELMEYICQETTRTSSTCKVRRSLAAIPIGRPAR